MKFRNEHTKRILGERVELNNLRQVGNDRTRVYREERFRSRVRSGGREEGLQEVENDYSREGKDSIVS